jgi:cobalt-zinc-cadmium efflux system protein
MNKHRSENQERRLFVTLILTAMILVVEVVGGLLTGSLALLSDAGHVLTDVGGLALALLALRLARRPTTAEKTFGYYRAEILAALVNAVVLFLVSFFILYEAYRRFMEPPEIQGLPMLAIAFVGLGANLYGVFNLKGEARHNLNIRGAFYEVLSDTLASVAVIVAAVIILTTGWYYADPLFSVVIALFILPRTWNLLQESVDVLLEATPRDIDPAQVVELIKAQPRVTDVHELHIWALASQNYALSAHVVFDHCNMEEGNSIANRIKQALNDQFMIRHATLEVECPHATEYPQEH